jgi:hypothetical protein
VRLVFRGVDEVEPSTTKTSLQCLLEARVGNRLNISFAGLSGLECCFTCEEREVVSVEPSELSGDSRTPGIAIDFALALTSTKTPLS